ncbi:MAG: hypothetical protein MUO43_15800 [Desulfobacterales bacterium]|nr:hypothetical protein [Desulfobacterales bacterium]
MGLGLSAYGLGSDEKRRKVKLGRFLERAYLFIGVVLGIILFILALVIALKEGFGLEHRLVLGMISSSLGFLSMVRNEIDNSPYFD